MVKSYLKYEFYGAAAVIASHGSNGRAPALCSLREDGDHTSLGHHPSKTLAIFHIGAFTQSPAALRAAQKNDACPDSKCSLTNGVLPLFVTGCQLKVFSHVPLPLPVRLRGPGPLVCWPPVTAPPVPHAEQRILAPALETVGAWTPAPPSVGAVNSHGQKPFGCPLG